jgi:hypothetical protein
MKSGFVHGVLQRLNVRRAIYLRVMKPPENSPNAEVAWAMYLRPAGGGGADLGHKGDWAGLGLKVAGWLRGICNVRCCKVPEMVRWVCGTS